MLPIQIFRKHWDGVQEIKSGRRKSLVIFQHTDGAPQCASAFKAKYQYFNFSILEAPAT
jgi:hypothetical protein